MYSTCIVWLAFIPIFFGTHHDYQVWYVTIIVTQTTVMSRSNCQASVCASRSAPRLSFAWCSGPRCNSSSKSLSSTSSSKSSSSSSSSGQKLSNSRKDITHDSWSSLKSSKWSSSSSNDHNFHRKRHIHRLKGSFTIFLFLVRSHILNSNGMWYSWFCPEGPINASNSKFLVFYFAPRDLDSQRHMGPWLAAQGTLTRSAGDLDSQRHRFPMALRVKVPCAAS